MKKESGAADCAPVGEIPEWLSKRIAQKRERYKAANMETEVQPTLTAQDLRIGNYLQCEEGKIVYVEEINSNGINDNYGVPDYFYSALLPIKITPELLEKCGFEKVENEYYALKDGVYVDMFEAHGKWWVAGVNEDGPGLAYVHQLQNLFQTVYLKKLEINL